MPDLLLETLGTMTQSSRELVKSLLEYKDTERVPFIPWVCGFAAKVDQIEVEAMLSDAGALSRALVNAQKLFGYDAICSVFDTSLEAEACGCEVDWGEGGSLPKVASHPLSEGASIEALDIANFDKRGRIPAALEATKRIKAIRGREVAIIGVVTGPLSLARHLKGDSFIADLNQGAEESARLIAATGNIALKLCRSYCELGVDAIAVAEETLGQISPSRLQAAAGPLKSIWNVARFYNVRSLIVSRGCTSEHTEPILGLGADGVALSGDLDYAQLAEAAQKRKASYARTIRDAALLGEMPETVAVADLLSARGRGLFLSTEWETPYATDINAMHKVMRIIRGG